MFGLWGRECKPGWGYNESLHRLMSVEGETPSRTLHTMTSWQYIAEDLSCTILPSFENISLLLEPNCRKILNFRITSEDHHYWEVHCDLHGRRDEGQKLSNYPPNCSHFVTWTDYGVDLRVQFPKIGFPNKFEMQDMFEKRNFNETQKQAKCRVLINFDEIKEMTLEELIESLKDLDERKFPEQYIPVSFGCERLTPELGKIIIDKEDEFNKFLTYLYYVYRKVELRMEKAAYPYILPDLDSQEKPFIRICIDLGKAKEDYKSMNRNNMLEMYPVLKRLFFCYTDYIRYLMENGKNIDEGKHLPGSVDEMRLWLRKLNTWLPKNINGEWSNCMDSIIVIPPGCEHVAETLHNITKYSNCEVTSDNRADEPYIRNENNENILFGFVDMDEIEKDSISDASVLFESDCPEQCTPNMKRWICTTCGEFVRIKPGFTDQLLFCVCGPKRYKHNVLICHHKSHQTQKMNEDLNEEEEFHPPVPYARQIYSDIFSSNERLSSIYQRFQELQMNRREVSNPKIFITIIELLSSKNEEEVRGTLRKLQDVALDRDTQHLIHQYLNERD